MERNIPIVCYNKQKFWPGANDERESHAQPNQIVRAHPVRRQPAAFDAASAQAAKKLFFEGSR
jgi:hypothetical protein